VICVDAAVEGERPVLLPNYSTNLFGGCIGMNVKGLVEVCRILEVSQNHVMNLNFVVICG
jgi:hypothetical protein